MASRAAAAIITVGAEGVAQRVDNFLLKHCKGVPHSHVYRVIRSGEVRVNSGRVNPYHKLQLGDRVRVPPIRVSTPVPISPSLLEEMRATAAALPILHDDDDVVLVNKPAGLAAHCGTGAPYGVVECMRACAKGQAPYLELVHRLDRGTSGLLLVAKSRASLTSLHTSFQSPLVHKSYLALLHGSLPQPAVSVMAPLALSRGGDGVKRSEVVGEGQAGARPAHTHFVTLGAQGGYSLVQAVLHTGRTHQIRVHAAHIGCPVVGDPLYGGTDALGTDRMFLHAAALAFPLPRTQQRVEFRCGLPPALTAILRRLHIPVPPTEDLPLSPSE